MPIELDLTFGKEGEKVFSLAGKHRRIRDFGFLVVAVFVGEDCLIIVFMFQSIMSVFQRLEVAVEGLYRLLVTARVGLNKGFEGAEASKEVILHPQGDADYWVYLWLRGDRGGRSCQGVV